jgi:TRAP-type transport system small permease protein
LNLPNSPKTRTPLESYLAVLCMALLVLITLGNVIVRYFSNSSFAWTEEISIFLMVVMTFAGAASVATRDQHIRIEYLYDSGSQARQTALRTFSGYTTATFFAVLAILFAVTLLDEIKYAETTMGLNWPRWWFTAWLPPLCGLIAIRSLCFAWRAKKPIPSSSADDHQS